MDDQELPPVPRYDAGFGIRPARKSGKFRAVAREVVDGGGMELWHCDHDHAPGAHSVPEASDRQREDAYMCAERWLLNKIETRRLQPLPVRREQ